MKNQYDILNAILTHYTLFNNISFTYLQHKKIKWKNWRDITKFLKRIFCRYYHDNTFCKSNFSFSVRAFFIIGLNNFHFNMMAVSTEVDKVGRRTCCQSFSLYTILWIFITGFASRHHAWKSICVMGSEGRFSTNWLHLNDSHIYIYIYLHTHTTHIYIYVCICKSFK